MNMISQPVLETSQHNTILSPFTVNACTPLDGYYMVFREGEVNHFEKVRPFRGHPMQLFHIPIQPDLLREGVNVRIVGFKCDFSTQKSIKVAQFEGPATLLTDIQTLALQLIQA